MGEYHNDFRLNLGAFIQLFSLGGKFDRGKVVIKL